MDREPPVPSALIERHVFQSVRLALEADLQGGDYINISAADTAMEPPSRDLMAEVFHDVLVDGGVNGTDTLHGDHGDGPSRSARFHPGLRLGS